jgi:processive 1,2-diacylglycerol beta-glucosyltransferase
VETALKREPGAEVENINTMKLTPEGVQAGQVKLFNVVSDHFKSVKTWAFRKSFEGSDLVYWLGNTGLKLKALASKPFLNKIKEENPDIILSTHSQTNSLLSYWKGKGLIDQPIHSVVTDFSAHRMWAQDHIDHYYVATESVKHDLERFGVPSEKIEVTGIPINPDFATKQSTPIPELKKKLGLDPDLPVVLMLGGSLGYGSFAEVSQALDTLKTPLQIVAITAKNAEKKQELEELAPALKKPLNVQGYVSNMKEWMEASDVIISKPGGLTTSEIFAVRKPMIIIDPMAGLEQILYPKIVETGCAEVAKDPEDAAAIIDRILTDSKFKEIIDDNLEHVGKPDAAFVVAEDLLRSAREKHD